MALNRYLRRLTSLIGDYHCTEVNQFETSHGTPATFEDLVWFYIDPNTGRKTRVLTGRHGTPGFGSAGAATKFALRAPYGDLIKIFVMESFNERLSPKEKVSRIAAARKLISNMSGDLYKQTADSIDLIFDGGRLDRLIPFIRMCERYGIMPLISSRLGSYIRDDRDRTGHGAADKRQNKKADETIIKALGFIFSRTVISISSSSNKSETRIRDAVPAFIGLLCLAAPNRAAAEAPLLISPAYSSHHALRKHLGKV